MKTVSLRITHIHCQKKSLIFTLQDKKITFKDYEKAWQMLDFFQLFVIQVLIT